MNLAQLIQRFRQRSDDSVATATLISDEDAAAFATEADAEALYRARLVFVDDVALTIEEGTREYQIDELIFDLVTVHLTGASRTLDPIDHTELVRRDPTRWKTRTGTPTHFTRNGTRIALYPVPVADDTATLAGYRTPLDPLTGQGDEPETPIEHHEHLVDWMLYRAYSTKDSEIEDPQRAAAALARFERHFGPRPTADQVRRQQEKRRNTVRYGGL